MSPDLLMSLAFTFNKNMNHAPISPHFSRPPHVWLTLTSVPLYYPLSSLPTPLCLSSSLSLVTVPRCGTRKGSNMNEFVTERYRWMRAKRIAVATAHGKRHLRAHMGCNSHFTSHLHMISKHTAGSRSNTMWWESITSDFLLENILAKTLYESGLKVFYLSSTGVHWGG